MERIPLLPDAIATGARSGRAARAYTSPRARTPSARARARHAPAALFTGWHRALAKQTLNVASRFHRKIDARKLATAFAESLRAGVVVPVRQRRRGRKT
jgi:hypothetical protein